MGLYGTNHASTIRRARRSGCALVAHRLAYGEMAAPGAGAQRSAAVEFAPGGAHAPAGRQRLRHASTIGLTAMFGAADVRHPLSGVWHDDLMGLFDARHGLAIAAG